MSDPTELVITLTFGLALVLFVVASVTRWQLSSRQQVETNSPTPPPIPVGRVPVWFYGPQDLVGAGFIFLLYAWLVISALGIGAEEAAELDAVNLVAGIGFQIVLAGSLTLSLAWRVRPVEWLGLKWERWPSAFIISPLAVVSMWILFGSLESAGYMEWIESLGAEPTQDTVKLLQESVDPAAIGLMAFAAVVIAPICEEIIFRGYLYPVTKRFAGPWVAALSSSLVFGAAHGGLASVGLLTIFALLLVFIYEKTGSLWATIAVHFLFNAATVTVQLAIRYLDIPLNPPQ